MAVYIGLDIGGTKFLVASANVDGAIIKRVQHPAPLSLDEGLKLLKTMVDEVSAGEKIIGFGAAAGGPLDWATGVISPLHQPAWRDVPLKDIFEKTYGCPLHVDVDTNAAALGEYIFGGIKSNRMLYLTISTGMGGGFLMDGHIYRGCNGSHPEAGHQTIPYRCRHPERVVCECGAEGCLEALISGNAIQRIYGKTAQYLDDHEVNEVSYNLGQGLRNLAVLYSPDTIVIGGGVAVGLGDRLILPACRIMETNLKLTPVPTVILSRLGYDTALLGAIALAIHDH